MPIKNLFLIFRKNEVEREFRKKLSSLEGDISVLQKTLQVLQEQLPMDDTKTMKEPPIIIEKINIEKIILDKYEVNNNFGQLGIKELKGKLNIGATYGGEYTPIQKEQEEDDTRSEPVKDKPEEKKPKINIQAKRENT